MRRVVRTPGCVEVCRGARLYHYCWGEETRRLSLPLLEAKLVMGPKYWGCVECGWSAEERTRKASDAR
jgi:hypothetical protein